MTKRKLLLGASAIAFAIAAGAVYADFTWTGPLGPPTLAPPAGTTMGNYQSSTVTLATGQMYPLQLDVNGNLKTTGNATAVISGAVTVTQLTAASLLTTPVQTTAASLFVTPVQTTAASLNATVTGTVTAAQATAASLNATVVGTVTAAQTTAASLQVAPIQTTAASLLMTPIQVTAASLLVTPVQATAASLFVTPVQTTAASLVAQANLIPVTTGGLSVKAIQVANNTVSIAIDASAGQLYGIEAFNNSTTIGYIKIYNASQGATTCGSGTPVYRALIPAPSAGGGGYVSMNVQGFTFSSAISICVTTGYADNDAGVPAATTYIVNAYYK